MSEKKFFLIVLGPGPGKELFGKDVLQVSIERIAEACPGIRVITVLPSGLMSSWKNYCAERNFNIPQSLVPAGFTPFHSVRKALERVPDGAVVIFQDGNRPLVSRSLVSAMLRRMEEGGVRALVPLVPAREPVLCQKDGIPSLPEDLFRVQMPQMYLSEDIKAAYSEAYDLTFTDPSVVAASKKIPLTPVEGERFNFKVETAEDLTVATMVFESVIRGNN